MPKIPQHCVIMSKELIFQLVLTFYPKCKINTNIWCRCSQKLKNFDKLKNTLSLQFSKQEKSMNFENSKSCSEPILIRIWTIRFSTLHRFEHTLAKNLAIQKVRFICEPNPEQSVTDADRCAKLTTTFFFDQYFLQYLKSLEYLH